MDNQLAYIDQASFWAMRAHGHEPVQQLVWIYDHDLNMDRLREVHRNLGYSLLGRRIERSPLPFGRHRWVSAPEQSDLEVTDPLSSSELQSWMDRQGKISVDPERGPSWRMAAVPFLDGGGAVTLVVSHSVADVGGILLSLFTALAGARAELGYPMPRSRTSREAVREDLRAFRQTMPDIKKALKGAKSILREDKPAAPRAVEPTVTGTDGASAIRPTVFAVVDVDEWDARAKELGGNSGSLVAGFAVRLGYNMGQLQPDGSVTLMFPVSDRGDGDARANALTVMSVTGHPSEVVTNLAPIRAALKAGLKEVAEKPNGLLTSLPLTQITPKWLVRRLERLVLGDGPVVGCSNMGDVPDMLMQIDGTQAKYVLARGVEWPIGRAEMDRVGNWLFVGSGRVNGKLLLFVTYWRVGSSNAREEAVELVKRGLADYRLSATFV